jgi:hypothetical protein
MLLLKYYPDLNYDKIQVIPPPAPLQFIHKEPCKDYVTILFLGDDFYRKGEDISLNIFKKSPL